MIFWKCLQKLPKGTNVLFASEVKIREKTIRDDAKFFEEVYGFDPLDGYNIRFILYQSLYKTTIQEIFPDSESTFICCDEVQDLLTDKRILFIRNSNLENVKILCLTATINKRMKYLVQGEEITKRRFIKSICTSYLYL